VFDYNDPGRFIAPRDAEYSAVRIFRLGSGAGLANLTQVVNAIRAETKGNIIFGFTVNSAIAMRGTPLQASQAERIVEQWNQVAQPPASPNPNQKAGPPRVTKQR
jgi:hypothetical protein